MVIAARSLISLLSLALPGTEGLNAQSYMLAQHGATILGHESIDPPSKVRAATPGESRQMPKVGEGAGRPLYAFNTIVVPQESVGNATASGEQRCVTLRLDIKTHAVTVDSNPSDPSDIAFACFTNDAARTGWSSLKVETSTDEDVPIAVRAWAAGFLEGVLTYTPMKNFNNNVQVLLDKDLSSKGANMAVDRALRMALLSWEALAGGDANKEPTDDISRQAWAALLQMRGLRDGYNLQANKRGGKANGETLLSAMQIMKMNMHSELPAMAAMYGNSEQAKSYTIEGSTPQQRISALLQSTASSFLRASNPQSNTFLVGNSSQNKQHVPPTRVDTSKDVTLQTPTANINLAKRWSRLLPSGSAVVKRAGPEGTPKDLFSGHVTFGDYGEMIRIMKTYNLKFKTLNGAVTLSSYPGCISSTDDYFITSRGFVIMSTNLGLPKSGEHSEPPRTDDGLPAFLRAMVATRLATQPRSWARIYGFTNGISAAKQWLIADYGKLKPGQKIANDTVWLVESLPRLQRTTDLSERLRQKGFVAVTGEPHFAQFRNIYGLKEVPEEQEEKNNNALLDKADKASSMASARGLLTDADSSRGRPVAARYDLQSAGNAPVPAGAIDAKLTNRCLVAKLGTEAKAGPPSLGEQALFQWKSDTGSDVFPGWPSAGIALKPVFDWASLQPGLINTKLSEAEGCPSGEEQ